jgi:DnaA family protein
MKQLALGVQLRADATFESFAPGRNAEVLAALASGGAAAVWLWGASGSGKTHLLQAVCAAAAVPAAYFPLHCSATLPPDALAGFERCGVLCLDDVDAVVGDPLWEQALFRLFNEAAELGTRLFFAARTAPRGLDWGLEDWRSRAAACVVYQVRELDEGGRLEALRLRAAQRGLDLPPETCEYLLRRVPRDLTSLYQILDQLDRASLAAQRRLTVPFIRDSLETLARTTPSNKTS